MFSFRLSQSFVDKYRDIEPSWGWRDEAGNSIGELTFVRTYSRVKDDGTKERWFEVCERVINGMYSIQKDHCIANRLEWNGHKAQASAQEAYDRMFNFKWTPPGRGLSQMGTPLVMEQKNAASLLNCANVSTGDMDRHDPGYVFAWTTEALMLGIGVGFDTLGAGKFEVRVPTGDEDTYVIPDTREGWAISIGKLVNSYLKPDKPTQRFDYSEIRPYGEPIMTFGGTASGPEPLRDGHEKIRGVLDANAGSTLSSKTIVDIQNIIGTFVVAGNARRSAELALGQPDDDDFVNLKNYERFPDRPWAYMSNNSISAEVGMDYSPFVKNTSENGEPGYIWLDNAKRFGRMVDGPDNKDARVTGFNPCVTGETMVMTSNGPARIDSLEGQPFDAIVDGEKHFAPYGSFITGTQPVFRLTTKEGYEVRLTANHLVMTASGDWVPAKELLIGDQIKIHNHREFEQWGDPTNIGDGYLMGLFVGDGNFGMTTTSGTRVAELKVWSGTNDSVCRIAQSYAETLSHRSDWAGWSDANDGYKKMTITGLPQKYGMNSTAEKRDISVLESESSEFYRGFLRGIFDADGHVEGYDNDKGFSVRLTQSNIATLKVVQRMLLRLGIKSGIFRCHEAGPRILPDGHGGRAEYDCAESNRLIVSADHAKRFVELIGFGDEDKMEKCAEHWTGRTRTYHKPFLATVESFEEDGVETVWDTTVEQVHAFDANGLYVHNCSEQPLESFEMCCLVETHLNRAESLEDFKRTLKFAYLYGKTVTLLVSPWPKTNAVMLRNRRIGLSTTGVAGFVDNHSLHEYRQWADEGYHRINELDVEYSEWLGIRESIRKTTVKPSGSVSLLSGATPGVHWAPGGEYFDRAIRFGDGDNTWKLLRDAGYKVEDDHYSPNTKVVFFPLKSDTPRSEKDVSVFEKANLAIEAQRWWSDNGVSVTVSFGAKDEADHIPTILNMAEGQMKAISFLPMGNEVYVQQPYTNLTEEEYHRRSKGLRRIDVASLYSEGDDAEGEAYCTTDVCEIRPAN